MLGPWVEPSDSRMLRPTESTGRISGESPAGRRIMGPGESIKTRFFLASGGD